MLCRVAERGLHGVVQLGLGMLVRRGMVDLILLLLLGHVLLDLVLILLDLQLHRVPTYCCLRLHVGSTRGQHAGLHCLRVSEMLWVLLLQVGRRLLLGGWWLLLRRRLLLL